MNKSALGIILTFLALAPSIVAHHGAASFDNEKRLTLKGTVTEWIWVFNFNSVPCSSKSWSAFACWNAVWRFWPIITNADTKIASSRTTSVNDGDTTGKARMRSRRRSAGGRAGVVHY